MKRFGVNRWAFRGVLIGVVAAAACAAIMASVSQAATCDETWAGPSGTTSSPTSGVWGTSTNWSPASVPTGSQNVCLNSGSYTVTVTGSESAGTVTVGSGVTIAVTISGGGGAVLNLDSAATSTNSGTIELTDSDSSGTGSPIARVLIGTGATLTNDGTILSDPGPAGLGARSIMAQSANSTLNNASDGTITVNQDLLINDNQAGLFETSGNVTIASGKKLLADPFGGLVGGTNPSKDTAEMDITGGTITDSGTFAQGYSETGPSGSAALKVSGGTLTGAGLIGVAGAPTDLAGSEVGASFSGSGSGTFTFVGCACASATTLGGTIAAGDTVVFSGSSAHGSANAQVNSSMTNNGTIELTDSDTSGTSSNAADFQIGTGATLTNDGTILSDPGPAGVGQRIITGQSASSTLDNGGGGEIDVNQPLQIDGTGQGTFTTSGSVKVASGQTLLADGGGGSAVFNLDGGAVTDTGTTEIGINTSGGAASGATLNVNGGTVSGNPVVAATATTNFSGSGSGSFTLEGATSIFGGGTVTGTIGANDNVTLSGSSSGAGSAVVSASGAVVNDGTFTMTDTDTVANGSSFSELEVPSGSSFTNAGTMTVAPGAGAAGYRSIDGIVHNTGTLDIDFLLQFALHSEPSGIDNAGTVNIATDQGLMDFGGADAYSQTAGTTTLNSGSSLVVGAVVIDGGSVTGSGTICGTGGTQSSPCGSGSGATTMTSAGTITPAPSPATLTVQGSYTQTSGGTLDAQVTSTGADRLAIIGSGDTATLDGNLHVSTASGFTPPTGQTYQVLTAPGGVSGTFSTTTGLASGPYTVTYNPTNVTLTAVASAARASFDPSSIIFGSPSNTIPTGETVHRTLTVTDSGTASLVLGSLSLTGTDASSYSLGSDGCSGHTLTPGDSCTVSVAFSPASSGTYSAAVSVPDNASGSPQQVSLTGYAGPPGPRVALSSSALGFGLVGVGSSAARTVTLANTGTSALQVNSATVAGADAGNFKVFSDSCTAGSIAAGSSCHLTVNFTPTADGSRTAHVSLSDTAPDSPQTVSLAGTGTSTGTLVGKVRNGAITSNPPPMAGARIELCGYLSNPAGCQGTSTDGAGDYTFSSLAPGAYHIELYPPQGYLSPAAAVVDVRSGINVQDFLLERPSPVGPGVTINGLTGTPTTFYRSPTTVDAVLNVPHGTPGVTGQLITSFWLKPAGSVDERLAFGQLLVNYVYDSAGVATFVSLGNSSFDYPAPFGTWATGLTSTPSVGEALSSLQAQAVMTPNAASPLHGEVQILIRQYSVRTSGGARDQKRTAVDRPAAQHHSLSNGDCTFGGPGDIHVGNLDGNTAIYLPNGDVWFPQLHELSRGYDGVVLSLGTDESNPNQPTVSVDGASGAGNNLVGAGPIYDPEMFASTGDFNPELANVYPDGSIPELDIKVNPDGSIVDQAPGEDTGRYQFNPDGSITDTVTGAVLQADGHTIKCPDDQTDPSNPPPDDPPPPNGPDPDYWDPSGLVSTSTHIPVAGAKVVLLRSAHHAGPFAAVSNGSIIMSPSNRRNPDHTTQLGLFGWDVFPGFYEVTAQHTRCKGAHGGKLTRTKALTVPPAVVGLNLMLRCPHLHRHKSRVKLAAKKVPLNEVVLTARVRGRHRPQGVVTFKRGSRKLGVVPISRAGRAVFTTTGTSTTGFRARYGGDGYNAPSSARG